MVSLETHMKKSFPIAVGTTLLFAAGLPLAQDTKAPASNPSAATTQPGSSMNMGSQMGQMDEHMKKMQALHERMATAATPDERQGLMAEQRQEMQQGMAMMQDMHDMDHSGPMMGSDGKGMKGKAVDQKTQMQLMDQRMDMMQLMMQSMMDQQGASGSGMMPVRTR
jgi:hypothetical protein